MTLGSTPKTVTLIAQAITSTITTATGTRVAYNIPLSNP